MKKPTVKAIFIASAAGDPMREVESVKALAGKGLEGDRYATAAGSFNRENPGKRQVTLINSTFFEGGGHDFTYAQSRRNIVIEGAELMWLIGREFTVGDAVLKGVKYCDPCERPKVLGEMEESFKDNFSDRGGLIAEVLETGMIKKGETVVLPPKAY